MTRKKWLPHIIAVVSLVAFIVLGLASDGGASTPSSYSSDSYSGSSGGGSSGSGWNLNMFGSNSIGGVWSGSAGGYLTIGGSTAQFKDSNGNTSTGTASISGNYLNLYFTSGPLAGHQFEYTIVSANLLQGSGENFRR